MENSSPPIIPKGSKTVLIVEDDPDSREVFVDVLERAGLGVVAVGTGMEALRYLKAQPPPSVIILDMLMPEMDGWQFRRAQSSDPRLAQIPVVVISGLKNIENSALRFGAAAFLGKPFAPEDLLKTVYQVV